MFPPVPDFLASRAEMRQPTNALVPKALGLTSVEFCFSSAETGGNCRDNMGLAQNRPGQVVLVFEGGDGVSFSRASASSWQVSPPGWQLSRWFNWPFWLSSARASGLLAMGHSPEEPQDEQTPWDFTDFQPARAAQATARPRPLQRPPFPGSELITHPPDPATGRPGRPRRSRSRPGPSARRSGRRPI